jgi:hypothetical protein
MTTMPVSIQVLLLLRDCAELMASKEVGSLIVMNKESF